MAARKNTQSEPRDSQASETRPLISLSKRGESLYIDRKSEFIGQAVRISSEDEARAIVASVKKQHPDARHTVFAYRLPGGTVKRYSDDGEPQGSAGMPVLDVLEKNGIDGALITVTRYFGGILLGTGGLVRAYSTAAADALNDAVPVKLMPHTLISASFEYTDWSKSENQLKRAGASLKQADYGAGVDVILSVAEKTAPDIISLITELTGGRSEGRAVGTEMLPEDA